MVLVVKRLVLGNKSLIVVAALTLYVGSYLALWKPGIHVVRIYTLDRGCIAKTYEAPEFRSEWIARGPLRGPITAIFWPINAFLVPKSGWR